MLVYDSILIKDGFLGSNRKIDSNGFLRVKTCNITKEQVAPYYGKEIPNWEEFGLEANKIYYVYRPETELAKAVDSFNNLPLTREHIEVETDNVPKDKIVGSLGDRAEYKSPYVKNSLIVYDQQDIDWIMEGKKKELSCGYRYTPVKQDGEWRGQHYDFVMTDIIGNHVALVKEGRAGHDVMVADEKPEFAIDAENDIIEEKDNEMFFDKLLAKDEFKESEHPRAKNGQFTSKGGSGSSEKRGDLGSGSPRHIYGQKKDGSVPVALKTTNYPNWNKVEIVKEFDNEEDALDYAEERGDAIKSDYQNKTKNAEKYGSPTWVSKEDLAFIKEHGRYPLEEEIEQKSKEESSKETTNDADISKEEKVGVVMKEFKEGKLKSSSGEKVTDPKQAKAIALSEAKQAKDTDIPDEQDKPETAGEEKAEKEDKTMEEKKKESLAEDKCAKDEKVDKRKLIDEIGGILKGKIDDELIRTVIGKAEKLAYEGSEAGEADDAEIKTKEQKEDFAEGVAYGEKKEKEEPKKLDSEHESEGMKKEEEKEAEDKCAKDKCDKKIVKDEMTFDVDAIKAQVRTEVMEDFKAREEARKAVKSVIGDVNVMAFDSCNDIYKMACEKAGLNVQEVVSYKDAFVGFMAGKSKLAMDATPVSSGNEECFKNIRI